MFHANQSRPVHPPIQVGSTSCVVAIRRGLCRLCHAPLTTSFVDLGMSPLCESFLTADQIDRMERRCPLHTLVCDRCFLVQLQEYVKPEPIFTDTRIFHRIRRFGLSMRAATVK